MNKIELMEYKKYKLGDICKIFGRIGFRGYTTEDLVLSPSYGAISLSPSNIVDGIMDLSKCTYISWAKYEESPEIKITPNDIVIVKTGNSYGRTAIIRNVEHPMTLNPQFVVLKDIQINPVYLAYFLKTDEFQKQIYGIVGGSAIPTLSQEDLASLIVRVPNENIQNTIADILDSLDGKIELNKLINDNLEAMAKQLYDYWFVQFDFPNEDGKPYKSSGGAMVWNEKLKREIPIGWTCCSIKEMCDINKKTINKDEHKQIEYLDTGSITQGHISNTEIYIVDMAPSRAQRKVEDLSILYSSVRPRLLHYGILSTPKENFIVSTGFVTLDAKCKNMALMVYYFLTSNTITEHLASIADTAVSSYPSISPDDIANLDIVIPSNDIIQKYNDIVEPMFRKMSTLRKEIDSLTKQRDELLPLLMNGQATVNYHLSDY